MPRYCYVNGRFLAHRDGHVHIEDRAYQFADSVYEVVPVVDGKTVDEVPHYDRLERSLTALKMKMPMARGPLELKGRELLRLNGVRNGLLYLQVSRGVAPRNHAFPHPDTPSAIVMTTKKMDFAKMRKFTDGVRVIMVPDLRWARCDIKTTSLLPNCLGKQAAADAGAYEAWMVDRDGNITEGTSSNAWIVTKAGKLVTRPPTNEILAGVTRATILRIAAQEGVEFEERPFSKQEALEAEEAFVSSATSFVTPVINIDETVIGNGTPGRLSMALLAAYREYTAAMRDHAA